MFTFMMVNHSNFYVPSTDAIFAIHYSSGGPLMDIVETAEGSRTGFLAVDALDYANCIASILYNSKEENNAIREAAR